MQYALQQKYPANAVRKQIELPTGVLSVAVESADLGLDQLCDFAARRNPKRGFLFVSRVLGKHIPVAPSQMQDVHIRLAKQLALDLPGPIVVIGMAETAIALGQGVFEEYQQLTGREDLVFIHSTRYLLDSAIVLQFIEEHSHAVDHIVYAPSSAVAHGLFHSARTIILVDDEASTGKTFVNLAQAFHSAIPTLEHVVTAMITDWRGEQRTAATNAAMPVSATSVSVLRGEYQFAPAASLQSVELPNASGGAVFKDHILDRNHGRLGITERYQPRPDLLTLAERIVARADGGSILVLGTGEFAFPPYRLALEIERLGGNVVFQTTTRSPIMTGVSIDSAMTFADNYEDGILNFLYNVCPGQYDLVVLAHETPSHTIAAEFVAALDALCVEM